ncbi:ATP-binding cassette domain-containing protein [bacterium]|nr:ATP-binding cassette domain-containing protein [bacterium]
MTGTSTPRLELHDLTLSVPEENGTRTLAEHLTLSLQANQLVAVNGPSGSGKSTVLRACIRLHEPASGTITLDGEAITSLQPPVLRRRIAYLRQFPVFTPGTVEATLLEPFGWKVDGSDKPAKQQLEQGLESLGLPASLLTQVTAKLSGGEAQRVALLRAFLVRPDVLLLDESSANLDPEHEATLVREIKRWVDEDNHAAMWVTHSRGLLRELDVDSYRLTPQGFEHVEDGQ